MSKRRRIVLWITAGLVVLILIGLALVALERYSRFDQQIWKSVADSREADNPRYRMLTDLELNYLRKGMTAPEVETLLGEPDIEKSPEVYKYNVGMQSGLRMDYDSFNVYFDLNGKFTHTGMQQH
jgi:hypothetical protein